MMKDEDAVFVENWCRIPACKPGVFVRKLRAIDLNDKQIAKILKAIDITCNHCWDHDNDGELLDSCTCVYDP